MKPNLIIAGAPKSGTTALYYYLAENENVFMSPLKEPHFFATDLKRGVSSKEKYLSLFEPAGRRHRITGEASVWYLYSKKAVENIYQFNPDCRIIVMLRDPVDLVYSKHAQLVYNFEEDEADFEKAWRLQDRRRRGEALPKHVVSPELLYYADIGKLGRQVERLLSIFPRDQVKIIIFDDFRRDTRAAYRGVLSFLGLPDEQRTHFPQINENSVHRSRIIGGLIRKPPPAILHKIHALEKFLGVEQLWGIDLVTRLNNKPRKRPPLNPSFRAELREEFSEDVKKLSTLTGRDLSHWLK